MPNRQREPIVILMADDDDEDRMMTQDALKESRVANELRFVEDGEQLMDYLFHRSRYSDPAENPRPDLIYLVLIIPAKVAGEVWIGFNRNPLFGRFPSGF